MNTITLPRLVGICGNPESGKSLVQLMMNQMFGYQMIDDGEVLRKFMMENFDLNWEDVYTKEGKAKFTDVLGKSWQNRDMLGTLGKHLEDMFGEHIMPYLATKNLPVNDSDRFSLGSVRKTQGQFLLDRGGVVLEIVNPDAPPSGFDFDVYDKSVITVSILNDGLSRGLSNEAALSDLEEKVMMAIGSL